MNKIRWGRALGALALSIPVLIAGCGGSDKETGNGTLRVALTDSPACGFDEVNVTVQKVRIHKSSSASENDGGWTDITLAAPKKLNLLDLQNGALEELGQTPLEAGQYQQMRLVLDTSTPLANSVVPTGGSEVALTTPSGAQSGLKMNVDITIEANKMADVVIDFDACKSVVTAGGSGKYNLKPVLTVIPRLISAVQGFIDTSLVAAGGTRVTLQQFDSTTNTVTVLRSTSPESDSSSANFGRFLLWPVAPGTYNVVITAPGHATEVLTGVVVTTETVTSVNTATTAFTLPTSSTGTANGTVTTGAAPIDASVQALQALTGGPTIEVSSMVVDATSGDYAFSLSTAAPLKAAWASGVTPTFAADSAVAGKYSLMASSGTASKGPTAITVTSGGTVTTDFTFP